MKRSIPCFLLFAVLLCLAGCDNPFQKPDAEGSNAANSADAVTGRVIINMAGAQANAKTLLPHVPAFTSYVLHFQYTGGGVTAPDKTVTSLPCTVDLTPGEWTIELIAYIYIAGIPGVSDGDYAAARGSATKTLSAGTTAEIVFDLTRDIIPGTKGTLHYDIGLPAEGIRSAGLTVLALNKTVTASKDLMVSASGNIVLDSGYYLLQVTALTGRVRSKTELIHIYGGQTTEASGIPYNFNTETGEYISIEELSDFLTSAPANTAGTPYPVKLNVSMASLEVAGDPLGKLFAAFHGKYLNLDLSDSTGNIGGGSSALSAARTDKDKLLSVKLPAGMTSMGTYVFATCPSLKSVQFPVSLSTMAAYAFEDCTALVSADLSNCASFYTIPLYAFSGCTSLSAVNLPGALLYIRNGAFQNCAALEEIAMPSALREIGTRAFYSTGLRSVNMSYCSSTEFLYLDGFEACLNLEEVTLPPKVRFIQDRCFKGCANLEALILPESVEYIYSEAFRNCSSLTTVALPVKVKYIISYAFAGCTDLVLSIPANSALERFYASALEGCDNYQTDLDFSMCSQLNFIDLSGCTTLESLNLAGCTKLTSIDLTDCTALESLNLAGCNTLELIDLTDCTALKVLNLSSTKITSPDLSRQTLLESVDFSGCFSLSSIDLHDHVFLTTAYFYGTHFNGWVDLSGCTALSTVNFLAYYTSTNVLVNFAGCTSLTELSLLGAINSIPSLAFSGCSNLDSITLLASVNSIGAHAFAGCHPDLTFTVTGTGNLSVDATGKILKLGSVLAAWPSASGNVTIPAGITAINGGALEDNIDVLTLPSTLTSFANILNDLASLQKADFLACTSITHISGNAFANIACPAALVFPSSIATIADYAFDGSGFTELDFSARTSSYISGDINTGMFRNCANLVKFIFPVVSGFAIQSLDGGDFEGCTSLTQFETGTTSYYGTAAGGAILTINASVLGIVAYPSAAGPVTIPNGIVAIGAYAFKGNTSITSVSLPSSLTSIYYNAFQGCTNLTSFTSASTAFTTAGGGAILCKSDGTLITWPSASGIVQIPAEITEIGTYAFRDNLNITEVDFSVATALTKIGQDSFAYCNRLTTVNLSGCTALTSIGDLAFETTPDAIPALTVSITNATPPTLGDKVFNIYSYVPYFPIRNNLVIKVPAGLVDTYKAAAGWSAYAAYITA